MGQKKQTGSPQVLVYFSFFQYFFLIFGGTRHFWPIAECRPVTIVFWAVVEHCNCNAPLDRVRWGGKKAFGH